MRPEFWEDETMAALPISARLTYVGTWCVADDAGYLEWKPREIAAALYRYTTLGRREKQVTADLDKLVAAGRIQILACGRHALIPTLEKYRIAGGKVNDRVKRAHFEQDQTAGTSRSVPTHNLGTQKTVSVSVSPSVSVSQSVSRRGGANGSIEQRRPEHVADVAARLVAAKP